MAETKSNTNFESLLEWAVDDLDSGADTLERLRETAPARMSAYSLIAAQSNMARIAKLHRAITKVEDTLLDNIDQLTPQQLMNLRGYLEKDLGICVDKMLPRSENGAVSPVQILQLINQGSPTGHQSPGQTSSALTAEGREKVRSFVKGLLNAPHPVDVVVSPLRVVANGDADGTKR